MNIRKLKSSTKRAFTLVEIMVATAIMIIMVALVIQITSEVLKVWNRAAGKLSAAAEARIALELLTSDLETTIIRDDGLQWLRAEKDTTGLSADPETNTVSLRLFAPVTDSPALDINGNAAAGDLCAVAYQLVRANPVTGETSNSGAGLDNRLWILYRLVVDPRTTFNELMGAESQSQLPSQSEENWESADGSTSISIIGGNGENYLVRNIVDFEIDFHVEDDGDDSTTTLVPDATIYGGSDPNTGVPDATVGVGAITVASQFQQPLAYAEIRILVVSDEGAALLQAVGLTGDDPADIIREHGEVFTRRVNFIASPL